MHRSAREFPILKSFLVVLYIVACMRKFLISFLCRILEEFRAELIASQPARKRASEGIALFI